MSFHRQRKLNYLNFLRKRPGIAQAVWLIPIFGLLKNIIDTIIIGKDSISERNFTVKEKLFKTLSVLCSLCFWGVIIYYTTYDNINTYLLVIITTLLQAGNWLFYLTGVYFSGELQSILGTHKNTIISTTQKVVIATRNTTKHAIHTTKKSAHTIGNTLRRIKIKKRK